MAEYAAIFMFLCVCAVLLAGYPAAFTLAGTALLFALLGILLGWMDWGLLALLPQRIFGILTNETLVVVPLFILMGLVLERSRTAEELLHAMTRLLKRAPAGLAISVTLVSTLLAASTGIVGATVVTLGLLCLPIMLKQGYAPTLSTGSIAAAGTLGIIIPPSIMLVLLADILSSAYQNVQIQQGVFALKTLSVGDLFAGALIPGLVISLLYMLYQIFSALRDPSVAPPLDEEEQEPLSLLHLMSALLIPLLLILAVLGSILLGIATPTEAASLGAAGAVLLAASKQKSGRPFAQAAALIILLLLVLAWGFEPSLSFADETRSQIFLSLLTFVLFLALLAALLASLYSLHRAKLLTDILASSARITSMVFAILIAAALFGLVFRGLGGDAMVHQTLSHFPGGMLGTFLFVMLLIFLLGFVLDFIEITFIVVPVVAPILLAMGMDPVWLGVMIAINLQTSFLTPPFGFALFYLRGVAPPTLATSTIYRGVVPFVGLQLLALLLVGLFPKLATFLPHFLTGAP